MFRNFCILWAATLSNAGSPSDLLFESFLSKRRSPDSNVSSPMNKSSRSPSPLWIFTFNDNRSASRSISRNSIRSPSRASSRGGSRSRSNLSSPVPPSAQLSFSAIHDIASGLIFRVTFYENEPWEISPKNSVNCSLDGLGAKDESAFGRISAELGSPALPSEEALVEEQHGFAGGARPPRTVQTTTPSPNSIADFSLPAY